MVKPYSNDLRQRCVNMMASGTPASKVALHFGVSKSSVIKWHQRYRKTGCVSPSKIGGYRRIILEPYRDLLLDALKQTPHLSVDHLHNMLLKRGVKVCRDTVWRFIRREGLSFKKNTIRD